MHHTILPKNISSDSKPKLIQSEKSLPSNTVVPNSFSSKIVIGLIKSKLEIYWRYFKVGIGTLGNKEVEVEVDSLGI